jgi:pyridoxal phosphate enzyme (YggS family)
MQLSQREIVARLQDNVARVRHRMAAAATRAGRNDRIRLIGVTKYVEPEVARLLATEGRLIILAESRPQELWRKAEALAGEQVFWHLIGPLQRNKVKRTLPLVASIQSVDSLRLVEEINREAMLRNVSANVLIEINICGDAAKHGIRPDELQPLLDEVAVMPHVCVEGLMTMAGLEGGPDRARRDFAALRELRDRLPLQSHHKYAQNITLRELSMGMSGDFEIAIEEGATMVRVGSALFEGIV